MPKSACSASELRGVETQYTCESEVEFKVLRIGNVEYFRLSLLVFLKVRQVVGKRKEVSCRLYLCPDGYIVVTIIA